MTSDPTARGRRAFEIRARHCYELQGRTWHDHVIWVSSPLVVEMASILGSFLVSHPERRRPFQEMRDMLHEWLSHGLPGPLARCVADSLATALEAIQRDSGTTGRGGSPYPRLRAAQTPVQYEDIIARAADQVMERCCDARTAGRTLWLDALCSVLPGGVLSPVRRVRDTIEASRWWFTHRDFMLVAAEPCQVHCEPAAPPLPQGLPREPRLHCLSGPAIAWPDGWQIHAVHGMAVPAWIIDHPERISVSAIEGETNAELRRVLIERYGWHRYITGCGAQIADEVPMDHPIQGLRGARLLRKVLRGEPEPLVYLEMVNSSAEPDGSHRRYLIRVDPGAYGGDAGRLCHAAMASQWRYRDEDGVLQPTFTQWQDYRPLAES